MSLVPLYRLQGHGDHFYTTDPVERDNAISEYGYTSEGVACYVYTSATETPQGDLETNEAFWRSCFTTALGNQAVLGALSPAEMLKYASEFADKCLLTYSDSIRRLRGQ